jgi:hypothetical protein
MDKNSNQVVSLSEFKAKKTVKEDLAGGRTPLYVSHLDGKVKGSPHFRRPDAEDFGDRLSRIRSSLERINKLMADLKKTSESKETNLTKLH